MTESDLKDTLIRTLRRTVPEWLVFRHEDGITSGVPDISINGADRTTWWEVKYTPTWKEDRRGIQYFNMRKLASFGMAFYIIYFDGRERGISIVEPNHLDEWRVSPFLCLGFNHRWVVDFMCNAQTVKQYASKA